MPRVFVPHKSSLHLQACLSIYRSLLRESSAVGAATSSPSIGETLRSLIRFRFHKDQKLLSSSQVANGISGAHGFLGLLKACAAKEPVALQQLTRTLETVAQRADATGQYREENASRWKPPPPSRQKHLRNLRQIASPRSHVSGSLSNPEDTTPRIFSHPAPISTIKAGVRKVPNLILAQGIPILKYSGPTPVLLNRVLKEKIQWNVRKWDQHKALENTIALAEREDEWDDILAKQAGVIEEPESQKNLSRRMPGTIIWFAESGPGSSWTKDLREVDLSIKRAVMERGSRYAKL